MEQLTTLTSLLEQMDQDASQKLSEAMPGTGEYGFQLGRQEAIRQIMRLIREAEDRSWWERPHAKVELRSTG